MQRRERFRTSEMTGNLACIGDYFSAEMPYEAYKDKEQEKIDSGPFGDRNQDGMAGNQSLKAE